MPDSNPAMLEARADARSSNATSARQSHSFIGAVIRSTVWVFVPAILCIGVGLVYMSVAPKTFLTRAAVALWPSDASIDENKFTAFLNAQPARLTANELLTESLGNPDSAAARVFGPAEALKKDVHVIVGLGDRSIEVAVESKHPQEAAEVLNRLIAAYAAELTERSGTAHDVLVRLKSTRQQALSERDARAAAFRTYKLDHAAELAASAALAEQTQKLVAAQTAAQLDIVNNQSALDSSRPILADPARVSALLDSVRSRGTFPDLDRRHDALVNDLKQQQSTLGTQIKGGLSDKHPLVRELQAKIEQDNQRLVELDKTYADGYLNYLQQQVEAAKAKVANLNDMIAAQGNAATSSASATTAAAKLESDLKTSEAALAEADDRIKQAGLSEDVGGISLRLKPASPAGELVWPRHRAVAESSLALGLVVGLLLATVRSWFG